MTYQRERKRGRSLWPSFYLAVQTPDREVERRREGHPEQIGHHQPSRDRRDAEEGQDRQQDGDPEQRDPNQARGRRVEPEEQPRPRRVEGQLDEEQPERPSLPPPSPLLPHQPRGDRHHQIERRPHRTEQP